MAMPLVEVPPEVVAPVRSPLTTTVSLPPPVLVPKFTVELAPMPVELVPPSTVVGGGEGRVACRRGGGVDRLDEVGIATQLQPVDHAGVACNRAAVWGGRTCCR